MLEIQIFADHKTALTIQKQLKVSVVNLNNKKNVK